MNQQEFKKRILFEDNHLLIVNKLPGELVQGDKTGDIPLLETAREYVRVSESKPGQAFLGLVHRLDRPTSGAVIFAKTSKALSRMNAQFEKREVDKIYLAAVKNLNIKEKASLTDYLKKNEKQNKSYSVNSGEKGAKKAVLHYTRISQSDQYSLLRIELETGRHHQIRAQLSHAGMPIRGDLKYKFPRSNDDGSIHLHAHRLIFIHPVSKEKVDLFAPLPSRDTLWRYFAERIK